MTVVTDLYADVVGQERAVAALRAAAANPTHAYLFVGPPGTGRLTAARAFAASLLCPDQGCGSCHVCTRALAGKHPDVTVFERDGKFISVDDAREISTRASLSPMEGNRKVLILRDFHLVEKAAPALLKTIEEPTPGTFFVILADFVPHELITIASRCVSVEFAPVSPERIAERLVAEGVAADQAAEVAAAAGGRLDRARLLATDPNAVARHAAWKAVPSRLDGNGATVAAIADELLGLTDTVVEPVRAAQEDERTALEQRAAEYGFKPPPAKELEARFKREQRRARTDEMRSGLATLASVYRERLASSSTPAAELAALDAIDAAAGALILNPNETLLLQGLLVRLGRR